MVWGRAFEQDDLLMCGGWGMAACCKRLLAGVAVALSWGLVAGAAAEPRPRHVHVLLIGIDDYAEAGLASLSGPRNDVALMRDVLTKRFAIPSGDIDLLINPTHSAIAQAFARLAQQTRRGDLVYIHYSGHGSTAADPGDPRGEDQTWVGFRARQAGVAGVDRLDVLDKEISVWLQPLYATTDDVVFVSDSCHSATVSRGAGVRSVAPFGEPHPLLASLPKLPAPSTGLRIGAARDYETAVELDRRTGGSCGVARDCFGVFTLNWARALEQTRPGESWGDVFARAFARISTDPATYQRPQIEGRADREVFGGRFAPLTLTVAVTKVETSGEVVLDAGQLTNVTIGSRYRSAGPAAVGATEAELRVTGVDALTSRAKLVHGTVSAGDLMTEAMHASDAEPIRLAIVAAPERAAEAARLEADLRLELGGRLSAFTLAAAAAQADWVLRLAPSAAAAGGAGRELRIESRQGLVMEDRLRFDLSRYTPEFARLVDDLAAFAWAQEVRRLGAQGNGTPVRLYVTIHRPQGGAPRSCLASGRASSGWSMLGPFALDDPRAQAVYGDCLSFELENTSADEHTWYGYVVAVGPDFAVHAIMPDPGAGSDAARMTAKERLRAPGVFYGLNQPGRETLLLLASQGPVSAQALQRMGVRDAPKSELDSVLAAAAGGRGGVERSGEWGAASRDIQVFAPPHTPAVEARP